MSLVVHEDEGGEVFHTNLPYRFHAQFGIFHALNALDTALRKYGGDTSDGAQIEATMLLAGVGNGLCTVTLGYHHERSAVVLELVNVGIHAVSGSWAHRTAGISLGSFGRSGVQNGIILEIFGHVLTCVKTCFELGMGNVTSHDDGAFEVHTGAYGVFGQLRAYGVHALIEVYLYAAGAFAGLTVFLGDKF